MPIYEIVKGGALEPQHIEAMGRVFEAVSARVIADQFFTYFLMSI
jgi:hypothetical protein